MAAVFLQEGAMTFFCETRLYLPYCHQFVLLRADEVIE
jgi:hypothetical protein